MFIKKFISSFTILPILFLFICNKIEGKSTIKSEDSLVDQLIVRQTSNGLVLGRKSIPTDENVEGFVFLGIPYAKPPVGLLRFQVPEDPEKFDIIHNGRSYGSACLWNSTVTNQRPDYTIMSEDCLQINVFTNKKCLLTPNCSVAVYIHGGAFNFDSPMILNESMIIQNFASPGRDVVFVTFQYREGIFGFANFNYKLNLSVDTNVGMFDMLQAMKWVKKEINNFGGDPNKITLTGHSSGSVSASLIYVSPKSKELFNQALFMSGTRPNSLFVDGNQNISRIIAIEAGCAYDITNWDDIKDVESVIKCLKNVDGTKLVNFQALVETFGLRLQGPYQDFGSNSFFEKNLQELTVPDVNLMTGTVKEEQSDGLATIESKENGIIFINKQKTQILCELIFTMVTVENYKKSIEACVNEYSSDLYRAKHIIDDINFFLQHLRDAKVAAKTSSKVYLYQFNYSVPTGVIDLNNGAISKPRDSPRHSDELVYLLGLHMDTFGDKERVIAKKFSQIIVDFINKGDPNSEEVKFDVFDPSLNNYFVIDFDENYLMSGMENNYHRRADTFWNEIMPEIEGEKTFNILEGKTIEMTPLINELEDGIIYTPIYYPPSYYINTTMPERGEIKSLLTTSTKPIVKLPESFGTVATISMVIFGILIVILVLSCIKKYLKHLERSKYKRFL
uniref:Carboxylic ester hydrolase n=1 Tax=Strongyloides venezuelensis TaxID=75913 RepID=A0A0K0FTQ6_STRVS